MPQSLLSIPTHSGFMNKLLNLLGWGGWEGWRRDWNE